MFVTTKRITLAQDAWVDIHEPSFFERKAALIKIAGQDDFEWDYQKLFTSCIEAWSDEAPVTPENINRLDQTTVIALIQGIFEPEPEAVSKN